MNPISALLNSDASLAVVIPIALGLLTLIVFVHELGHFFFARRFGVGVKEFAIGFPPRVWSRVRGGRFIAAHAVGAPRRRRVDGYLRRMSPPESANEMRGAIVIVRGQGERLREDLRQVASASANGAVIVGGDVRVIETTLLSTGDLTTVRIDDTHASALDRQLAIGDLPAELQVGAPEGGPARLRLGGTRFAINWLPLGGYVRMVGEGGEFDAPGSFTQRRPWQRAVILVAGPFANFLLAPLLFLAAALIADVAGAEVTGVAPSSPAAVAGLQAGDRLVAIGGQEIHSPSEVPPAVRAAVGRPLELEIRRGDVRRVVVAVPRPAPPPGEGALGIRVGAVFEPLPLHLAIPRSLERTVLAIALLPMAIADWVSGSQAVDIAGPVGIVDAIGQAARQGPEVVFFLAALLSAQIGLINLLPWPGLDGGRLVFVAFEWLTGRRLPPRREAAFHFVGIMLLLTLAVLITVGDVQRLVGA
jgi:regulator of sigma E protease